MLMPVSNFQYTTPADDTVDVCFSDAAWAVRHDPGHQRLLLVTPCVVR